jgi:hypothetical protein
LNASSKIIVVKPSDQAVLQAHLMGATLDLSGADVLGYPVFPRLPNPIIFCQTYKTKRLILILVTLTLLSFSLTNVWSADFQKGLNAYKRGD